MTSRHTAPASRPGFSQLRAMTPDQWQSVLAGDPAEAAQWLGTAARYGVVEAQTALAQVLLDGRGVPRDVPAAVTWFEVAAGAGHAPAINMLGRCCERGWGMSVDLPLAAGHYRRAAEKGLDWGQYNLANMLLRGRGVVRDRVQAFSWYRRAAEQGHAKSINMIGRYLEDGWDMPRDHKAAASCYLRAAEGGDFRAQYNFASLLARDGDVAAAVHWLRRAVVTGTPEFLAMMATKLAGSEAPELRAVGALAAQAGSG